MLLLRCCSSGSAKPQPPLDSAGESHSIDAKCCCCCAFHWEVGASNRASLHAEHQKAINELKAEKKKEIEQQITEVGKESLLCPHAHLGSYSCRSSSLLSWKTGEDTKKQIEYKNIE